MSEAMSPRLSIVIPWRGRAELAQALPSLSRLAARNGAEILVVNYGGEQRELEAHLSAAQAQVPVIRVGHAPHFNKAKANNIGAHWTTGGLLFFCDCDIVVPEGALDELIGRVAGEAGVFGTVAGVFETSTNARAAGNVVVFGYELRIRLRNGRELRIADNEEDASDGSRQAPGLLIVRRSDFEAVGGYNGAFEGWGWEDQDMIARLSLSAGLRRVQGGSVSHISHSEEARIRYYPAALDRWESRDRIFRQALANYDADNFQGTLGSDARRDIVRFDPPVPRGD